MKKLILPIILSFFINLFLLFIFVPPAQAINLNGEWIADKGARGELSQSGNIFSLIITYSRFEKLIGVTALKGTITGDTFIGQVYVYTDECPNLDRLTPARGIISEGKIEAKFTRRAYDPETCVRIPSSDAEGTMTLTRIITPSPTPQPTQNTKPVGDYESPFSIFAFNPLETWRNIQEFLDTQEGIISLVQSSQILTGSGEILPEMPRPSIAFDPEGKPWNFLPGFIPYENIEPDSTVRVTERTRLSDKNNQIYLELRPGQSSKAVLKIPGKNEKNLLFLEEGEVEVVKNKPGVSDSLYDGIKTPNGTVISVETHYLVSYDQKKNQTTVVVYEGKVEVKTNDGKVTTITPNGDKPGVVVIAQKLSVVKLVLVGLVIAGIGAAMLILKKRALR